MDPVVKEDSKIAEKGHWSTELEEILLCAEQLIYTFVYIFDGLSCLYA